MPTTTKVKILFVAFLHLVAFIFTQSTTINDFGVCVENYDIRYRSSNNTSFISIKSRAKFGYHFITIANDLNNPLFGLYITLNIFQHENSAVSVIQLNGASAGIYIPGIATDKYEGFFSYNMMKHVIKLPNPLPIATNVNLDDIKSGKLSIAFGSNYQQKPYKNKFNVIIVPKPIESFSQTGLKQYYECSRPLDTLEFYHPAVYTVSLLILIIFSIFNLLILYFKPIRLYGFLPFICCFYLVLRLCLKSYLFSTFQFQSTFWAYFLDNLSESLVFTLYFILPLNLIRFIILIDLSRQRIKVSKKGEKLKWYFKILKLFNNPFIIWLPFILIIHFILISIVTSLFVFPQVIPQISYLIGRIIYLIILIILSLIVILIYFCCFVFDISSTFYKILYDLKIGNLKLNIFSLPFQILKFLWREDRFYFRLQYYILIPISFFVWILNVISRETNRDSFVTALYGIIWPYIFFISTSGVLIILTLFEMIRRLFRKKIKEEKLDELFHDKTLSNLFLDFSESEFSSENVKCFFDIHHFYEIKDFEERKEHLKKMKSMYFDGSNSELEVNLPGSQIKEFDEKFKSESFENEILEKIEMTVRINLSDTYSRFIISWEYHDYLLSNSLKESEIQTKDQVLETRSIKSKL
eukprot:gene6039-10040_t